MPVTIPFLLQIYGHKSSIYNLTQIKTSSSRQKEQSLSPSSPKFQIHFTQKLYLKSTKQTLSLLKHPFLQFSFTSNYTKALSNKPIQTIIISQNNPFLQFSSKSNYTKACSLYQTNTNHHHPSRQPIPPILLQIQLHKGSLYQTNTNHHHLSK